MTTLRLFRRRHSFLHSPLVQSRAGQQAEVARQLKIGRLRMLYVQSAADANNWLLPGNSQASGLEPLRRHPSRRRKLCDGPSRRRARPRLSLGTGRTPAQCVRPRARGKHVIVGCFGSCPGGRSASVLRTILVLWTAASSGGVSALLGVGFELLSSSTWQPSTLRWRRYCHWLCRSFASNCARAGGRRMGAAWAANCRWNRRSADARLCAWVAGLLQACGATGGHGARRKPAQQRMSYLPLWRRAQWLFCWRSRK